MAYKRFHYIGIKIRVWLRYIKLTWAVISSELDGSDSFYYAWFCVVRGAFSSLHHSKQRPLFPLKSSPRVKWEHKKFKFYSCLVLHQAELGFWALASKIDLIPITRTHLAHLVRSFEIERQVAGSIPASLISTPPFCDLIISLTCGSKAGRRWQRTRGTWPHMSFYLASSRLGDKRLCAHCCVSARISTPQARKSI